MTHNNKQDLGFSSMKISPSILDQLKKLGFETPTPIQNQAMPIALNGQDLMGIAQTGTGKTLAFGIPMIQRLSSGKGTGLILLPTRELAAQVEQSLQAIGRSFGLRTVLLIGGAAIGPQIKSLAKRPHIIIATPGRLIDHLQQKKVILNTVKVFVLDEADRMLDMGFEPQIKRILSTVPSSQRQTMLFSATMPEKITKLANTYMRSPLRVEVAPAGTTVKNIAQEVFIVSKSQKTSLLKELLGQYHERILVFSRTKHGAKRITKAIQQMGYRAAEIHSNKSLLQRTKALRDFKTGTIKILVATDIASRGIDVKDIELVINYDLPDNPDDYVHRIGRTGRAGKKGKAISFAAPDQKRDIQIIERLVQVKLPIKPLPPLSKIGETLQTFEKRKSDYQKPRRNSKGFGARKRPSGQFQSRRRRSK